MAVRPMEASRVNALASRARADLARASRALMVLLRDPTLPHPSASGTALAELKDAVRDARDACGEIDYMTRPKAVREVDDDAARDDLEAMRGWD